MCIRDRTKRATTNPAEALQGKIAGVNIMKSGGNAGAGVSVKIRGVKSFGSNEPLYIIDGFPGDIGTSFYGWSSGQTGFHSTDIQCVPQQSSYLGNQRSHHLGLAFEHIE